MAQRYRKTKQEVKAIFEKSPFKHIKNRSDLVFYLKENPNTYNNYMLQLIDRQDQRIALDEQHHIIPTSEGGPCENWNLIPVTYKEHGLAHKLRYEVYNKQGDYLAFIGRENLPETARIIKTERAKMGHKTMKEKGIGFYNSDLQSELGKRSAGIKTPEREVGYTKQVTTEKKELFSKALVFTNKELSIVGETKPNQFTRTGQIKDYLVSLMPEGCATRELILNDKQFTTNINKILNPLIKPSAAGQTKLSRMSYKGWSVTF